MVEWTAWAFPLLARFGACARGAIRLYSAHYTHWRKSKVSTIHAGCITAMQRPAPPYAADRTSASVMGGVRGVTAALSPPTLAVRERSMRTSAEAARLRWRPDTA